MNGLLISFVLSSSVTTYCYVSAVPDIPSCSHYDADARHALRLPYFLLVCSTILVPYGYDGLAVMSIYLIKGLFFI